MRIPHESLSEAALAGVIESFVLREGTEYGERDVPLARKCAEVRRQLDRGEAYLDFEPESGSMDIRPVSGIRQDR